MKLFEPIVVDLYKPFPLKKVDMQQNNIGRGVIVTLTAGSTIVDPSDEDVKLWAERPDGNISYLACTVQTDGTIRAPFSSQMLSVPGEVVVSLEMISGEDDITTPIFKVGVGRNIADHTAAESQNEFSALQESISSVNAALAEVEELKEKGLSKVTFSAYADFPEVGNAEMLYVDTTVTDKLMVYRWNGTGYVPAGENIVYSAYADFPEVGNAEMLYVDTTVTDKLMVYRWNGTGYVPAGENIVYSAYADFPEVGNVGLLYVDTSDTEKLMMYRWNGAEYAPAGVDVVDPALATVLGFAADAKLTGDALNELNKKITVKSKTLTESVNDAGAFYIGLSKYNNEIPLYVGILENHNNIGEIFLYDNDRYYATLYDWTDKNSPVTNTTVTFVVYYLSL